MGGDLILGRFDKATVFAFARFGALFFLIQSGVRSSQ